MASNSNSPITTNVVEHIAMLSRLGLKPNEITKFQKELSEIIIYVEKLNAIDTKDIKPTSQVTGLENVMEKDSVEPCLPVAEALANAPHKEGNLFKVSAVLDE